jgi:uncharacterized protein YijF (DUF1287 family)
MRAISRAVLAPHLSPALAGMRPKHPALPLILVAFTLAIGACDASAPLLPRAKPTTIVNKNWSDKSLPFGLRLSAAAEERATHLVRYDAAYLRIPYPMGDVPADQGVCSDEVIRAYRLLGIDLQKLVHEDMARAFHLYPKTWGLKAPDRNIDHRRVPNLAKFFKRHGRSLTVSDDPANYKPGDVVAWTLADGRPHIGIVTEQTTSDGKRPLVMHNMGAGPQIEDMLFGFRVTGHYRYAGPQKSRPVS